MKKSTVRLVVLFSLIVFIITLISIFILGAFLFIFYRAGVFTSMRPAPALPFFAFCFISITISTVIARIIGSRFLAPISDLNQATKEIAKGNFNVRLPEDTRMEEVREMAANFNIMARELGNTEIFRNDFITNVSHEFKTPISAIEGYATLLQDDDLAKEERQKYVEKILHNSNRLSQLANNILMISRLESQNIPPNMSAFSLDEQIRQTILLFEREWTRKNIGLDIDLETVSFQGNEAMLFHVWQNIFGNAVKFTGHDGNICIMLHQTAEQVIAVISDDGIGMDKKTQKRIFEKFYQGDTSHSSEGNGLGLALAKRIVELHRGSIKIESTPGQGSCFTVSLPTVQHNA